MLETVEAWSGFVLVLIIFGTLLACFLMWYGAGLAGIDKSGFWRSFFGALFACFVTYLLALAALTLGPPIKTLHGIAVGLLLSAFIFKGIYRTSLLKAVVPWLFFVISQALAILAGSEMFIGSLKDLIQIL